MACHEDSGEDGSEPDRCGGGGKSFDFLLWGCGGVILIACCLHLFAGALIDPISWLAEFCRGVFELVARMWWGVLLGVLAVGFLARVPRELVIGFLGRGHSFAGLVRAAAGGVLLDLCSHGILLVGMQLYRRGASLGQTVAFLVASPWNSLSLTLILVSLIGWKWTLLFIALSVVIALLSGIVFEWLVRRGVLAPNPNSVDLPRDFDWSAEALDGIRGVKWNSAFFAAVARSGVSEASMILRWIFLGTVLAGLLRAFVPDEIFGTWFGPSIAGLGLTLLLATVLEVCSEGSSPIAADLLGRAGAPGNAFTFLMAGVSTDYTEILSLRQTTKSWRTALFLPLVTVPQIVALGIVLNLFAVESSSEPDSPHPTEQSEHGGGGSDSG